MDGHQSEAFVGRYVAIHGEAAVGGLRPAALDAYLLFDDLCLLAGGEVPVFLRLEYLQRAFALELIESVLGSHHRLFRQVIVLCIRFIDISLIRLYAHF